MRRRAEIRRRPRGLHQSPSSATGSETERTRQIECYDYAQSSNPPVLHRKDSFLHPEHGLYTKFARLTAQEEKNGLLDDPSGLGTREGWNRRLAERGFALKGHRLVRSNGTSHGEQEG